MRPCQARRKNRFEDAPQDFDICAVPLVTLRGTGSAALKETRGAGPRDNLRAVAETMAPSRAQSVSVARSFGAEISITAIGRLSAWKIGAAILVEP